MTTTHKPRIGLALGSGSARGWSHIGVFRALEEAGIRADLVCGTSIGALVGAVYAAGELDALESWVLGLQIGDVVKLADISLGAGLLKGDRLMQFLQENLIDRPIEELQIPFAAVATSLQAGAEVWLQSGSALDAVRASIAMPGVFNPVHREGSWLVDGGLVNPVPVSLARAMGADIVIAVDLGSDILGRRFRTASKTKASASESQWMHKLRGSLNALTPDKSPGKPPMPSMIDVLSTSVDITQVRITRSRLAGNPPDILVAPRLGHLNLFDFHCAEEAIEEGRRAVERVAYSLALLEDEAT